MTNLNKYTMTKARTIAKMHYLNKASNTVDKLYRQNRIKSLEKLITEQLILSDVSHSKNLTLLKTIENTKQLPQVQYDLQRQLIELRVMANKLGLYDAADFIKPYCG
jgi:hypothetical protein